MSAAAALSAAKSPMALPITLMGSGMALQGAGQFGTGAAAAAAQPGFDTTPPALNTRVPGQTTAVTPRGKFMWQADGWHPIGAPAAPPAAPGP